MPSAPRTITPTLARRLAVMRQRLAGPRATPDAANILQMVQDIGCLQLDPISAVARSHTLVLWSRFGQYDPAIIDTLLWRDRSMFEYWAHCASIVPASDFPLHQARMRDYADAASAHGARHLAWLASNATLRHHMLAEFTAHGPLSSQHFADDTVTDWNSSGWTSGRNVSQMLHLLWSEGIITVAGRRGQARLWDLTERHLPEWTSHPPLPDAEVTRIAAQRALRALGVARANHIRQYFLRGRYPDLPGVLSELQQHGTILPVRIADGENVWPGEWYIHHEDMALLDALAAGAWEPRTTLLSPFDNLICDRARTELLFGFDFRIEIYVPKAQRKYGYYVLPILHGDHLIGRIDPLVDRKQKTLTINAAFAEPHAPRDSATTRAVIAAIEDLARFVGAQDIVYPADMPWRIPANAHARAKTLAR